MTLCTPETDTSLQTKHYSIICLCSWVCNQVLSDQLEKVFKKDKGSVWFTLFVCQITENFNDKNYSIIIIGKWLPGTLTSLTTAFSSAGR